MKQRALLWITRILAILATLFIMMFSLDCFDLGGTDTLICLVMSNIPVFIIIAVLIIAWKWELIGGILFVVVFFAAGIYFKSFTLNPASLMIILPFLLTGILFILYYYLYIRGKLKV